MTKYKERDDALIAEAERLATKATQSTTKSLAWIEECQSALIHLVRSNWQPAPKPDRAEMLARDVLLAWSGYQQLTDEEARSEDFAKACRFTQTALAELRAEWEAERLEIPPHKHYSTPLIERLNGPHEWGYRDPVEGGFIADMSPFEASDRLSELEAERPAVVVPREEQIKQMVTRFLGWKLPEDFHPDDGISFEPFFNVEWNAKQGKPPQRRTPTGTNLFNATQAEAMVRYMLGDDT